MNRPLLPRCITKPSSMRSISWGTVDHAPTPDEERRNGKQLTNVLMPLPEKQRKRAEFWASRSRR